MPRRKTHRRGRPGSPTEKDRPRPSIVSRKCANHNNSIQSDLDAVNVEQLQEIFKDTITPDVVQLLYIENNGKVEPTLDALITMADPVRPSLVSRIKEDEMDYPEDPFISTGIMRNNLSTYGNSSMPPVGSVVNNKPVGFERSKMMNESTVNARVNVPPLFTTLPHSEYDGSGMRHERSESVDCVPLLTPVDFPGFNFQLSDISNPLANSAIEPSQIRQPITEEVNEPPEQFGKLISTSPVNIPNIPHRDTFHMEKQPSLSPKSPKMEQNLPRSPKSAPRSPKGQPKSPHQTKSDSKGTGKKKSFEKYQVPPRLKRKAKSHEITCIDRLQPEQQADRRRKSLPATLYNPILNAIKEKANYLPTVDCENISIDVPDNVTVIPEEDEDKHSDVAGATTEDADLDVLLSEIHITTNTNKNEEDDSDQNFASRKNLSIEDHKKSNFGKRFDDEKSEIPKQTSMTFNGMQEEARMSLSQLNVGAKEFVPRTTTTPEPKAEDSDSIIIEQECPKPIVQDHLSKNIRKVVPYIMPAAGKLAYTQPNGHETGGFVYVPCHVIYQTVVGRQTPSPDHYLQSNATPPNSCLGSPVMMRRPTPGTQAKRKKRKKNSKNKLSKESEKCQSSKESVEENECDKVSLTDNQAKTTPVKGEPLIPKPVNNEVPIWPKIRTNYKSLKKSEATNPEEPQPLPDGKVLCLMRGLPGSGKTTLARKLQRDGGIYSTDDYFVKRNGEYEFRRELLTKAHEWNQNRVREALEMGISPVIVDNTNLEKWVMRPYIDMAMKVDYKVVIRESDAPWKMNVNQLTKHCTHGVSKDKIASLFENYEPDMTIEKVMGSLLDWKKTKETCTEEDNTRTKIAQNKLNTKLYDQNEQKTNFQKCIQNEQTSIGNGGNRQELDAARLFIKKLSNETAQQHLKNIRKIGNVCSPNISSQKSSSVEYTNSVELPTVDKLKDGNSLEGKDNTDQSVGKQPCTTVEYRKDQRHPAHYTVSSETNRRTGISNKKRIHSLIKEDKVEISDDDEIDRNIHGDVFDRDTCFDDDKLIPDHSDVGVNVDAMDFALLQRIEAGLQNKKLLKTETVRIGIGSNFIPSYFPATKTAIPLIATLDKGSMTLDSTTNDDHNIEILEFLDCFPSVPREDLLDVLKKCDNDTNWASEILLDSNLYQPTESPKKQSSSDFCNNMENPELVTSSQEKPTFLNTPSNTTSDPDVVLHTSQENLEATENGEKVEDKYIIMQLDAKFGSKLQDLFGHDGCNVDLDLVSREDLQIAVPYDLASKIYETWLETLKKKHLAENRAANIGKIKADEDLAKKLQQEEEYLHMKELQEAKLSRLKHRPWLRTGHNYKTDKLRINPDGRATYEPVLNQESEIGLREIMEQEINLQLVNDFEGESLPDEVSMAVKIKREMLFKRFPNIDKDVLESIFSANHYHLSNTICNIERSYDLHPNPVQIVLSDKARNELEQRLVLQADEDNHDSDESNQTDLNTEFEIEYPDDAEYVDFRVNAIMHKKLLMECLQKSREAYQRGEKPIASYYSEKSREHKQKIKEANQEAAKRIHQKLNKNYLKSNIIDLHHFHVDEAVKVLEDALKNKKQELKMMKQKPKTLYLSVITGRGKNSPLGIARIRQAVQDHLERHKYQFSESSPGLIKVSLKPDC